MTPPARRGVGMVRRAAAAPLRLRRHLRRRRLLLSVRVQAAWQRSSVSCDVARDVRLGRGVRVSVAPRTSSDLSIGPGCSLGDDVRIALRGGELVLGRHVDVRHGCVLGVRGRLELEGPSLVQHRCTVHCDEAVTLAPYVVLAEYVTVIDSSHVMDGASTWFVDDVRSTPVVIEAHSWVGAKATVARGVRLGERCVVGANSLVIKDVPPGALASGVPAGVVRRAGERSTARAAASPPAQAPATVAGRDAAGGRMPSDALSTSS